MLYSRLKFYVPIGLQKDSRARKWLVEFNFNRILPSLYECPGGVYRVLRGYVDLEERM
jgi:hypothetical protein